MPSVILTQPVTHGAEDLPPGATIPDLTDKEAKRLVGYGVAKYADNTANVGVTGDFDDAVMEIADSTDTDESEPAADTAAQEEGAAADDGILSPEEREEIMQMPKATVIEHLTAVCAEFKPNESTAKLREKLIRAWSEPADDTEGE